MTINRQKIPTIILKKPTMQPDGLAFSCKPHLGQVSAFELTSALHSLHLIMATLSPRYSGVVLLKRR